ncbi:site-2 protease family protein [Brackiella oedipodis]|uniref:site-2 protease family protein n=1 Tax=Brackiella oedipodis TaxID=124225 RepID=UPI00048F5B5B|nr:site-2 protease family protein [Brackiella oedipodis]
MDFASSVRLITVAIIPIIFAVTLHEAAHGYVASRLGDNSAKAQGRLTLNPLPHIDPIGTIVMPILGFVMGGFLFGWAKPVPINSRYFKKPRRDIVLVTVAGPLANLLMAILWCLIFKISHLVGMPESFVALMAWFGIRLNITLMVFNLLPIPPLDGGHILMALLPPQYATTLAKIQPYGFIIVILLIAIGVLTPIIMHISEAIWLVLRTLFF